MKSTFLLATPGDRDRAKSCLEQAPPDFVMTICSAPRTLAQEYKLRVLLRDISRAKPNGIIQTPEVWKCVFMHALGHECLFVEGLNGEPLPAGFHSSRLSKGQMSELIEFVYAWSAQNNIELTTPN